MSDWWETHGRAWAELGLNRQCYRAVVLDSHVYDDPEALVPSPAKFANLVGSRSVTGRGSRHDESHLHRPLLDVDVAQTCAVEDKIRDVFRPWVGEGSQVRLVWVPSTTNWHCYVQHVLPELGMCEALMELAVAGIVEPGYAVASIRRSCAYLRLPWIRKGDELPAMPTDEADPF